MMNLAENLLNSLPETAYENSRIAGSGAEEEHIIVDESRKIIVPYDLRLIAVKGDKNIETVTIDCIRYWDGHDLSEFSIYINCRLPNGDDFTYIPEEINVKETYFSFDWVIGREITSYVGKLTFWVVAKLKDEQGNDVYQWSSLENSDCYIADGGGEIYVPEVATEKDVLTQDIQQVRIIEQEITEGKYNTLDFGEPHIVVNKNRQITVPDNLKLIAVKGDKNVETTTIDCVRWWDGHDLSTFAVYINYTLPNGNNGTYIPEKLIINEDVFSFDWVIGRHISSYVGTLTFWIVAKITDDDGNLTNQWSSLQNSECRVENGGDKIYVPEEQTDKDVISQAISASQNAAAQAEESAKKAEVFAEMAESGMTGPAGTGIESITLEETGINTEGRVVNTYDILLTDGRIKPFHVTDGKDGKDGEKGDKGDQGEQGIQGEKGDKGDQGEQGIQGEEGKAGNITINGTELKFFTGTKAEYDALSAEEKENLFAIITDDPTQIGLIDTINGFLDGSIPIPNIEQNYVRKDKNKIFVCSRFNNTVLPVITTNYTAVIGKFPEGKTLDEIAGVAALIDVKLNVQVGVSLSHSARLYLYAHKLHDVVSTPQEVKFHLFTVTHDVTTTNSGGTTAFTNPVSMASMDIRLCNAGDNNISIIFDNGAYTVIGDDRNGHAKLSDGVFKLINVRWWFK